MENAVKLVTIKSLRTLYKNGEAAERIEMANCEEHAFDVVVQKGLYQIGDKALYISPDYCVPLPKEEGTPNSPATKLFLDFTMPNGDPKKSKLGKNGRIRAIKFNFQLEGSSDPVYSVGIMMPLTDVEKIFADFYEDPFYDYETLDTLFEVTKYEEPESAYSGLAKGKLPSGLYATDETNIKSLRLEWPMTLTGTTKIDGSSITIYYRNEEQQGICSRNLEKKLDQEYIKGYATPDGETVRKHYDKESNVKGWVNDMDVDNWGTAIFHKDPDPSWTPIMEEVDDTFVKIGTPFLEKLKTYCNTNGVQLALRGELCGQGLKGSGNKNNPHAKLPQQIIFFAIDDYSSGIAKRVPLDDFYRYCEDLTLNHAPVIFKQKFFESWEELKSGCESHFKDNLIEGIVVKSDDARFSCKFMNDCYDSTK